jgi:hypothetical protein
MKAAGYDISDSQVDLVDYIAQTLKTVGYRPSQAAVKMASTDTNWESLGELWLQEAQLSCPK